MKIWNRRAAVAIIVSAACLLVACGGGGGGGDSDQSASEFVVELVETVAKGQHVRAWEQLHPAHQAIATREAYVACREDTVVAIEDVKAIEEYPETEVIPELGETVTQAVTVSFRVGETTLRDTFHAVPDAAARHGDGWRWVLPTADLEAYRAGDCPD